MIFGKNKEQTMRQLQFKFDPLPSESAEICLFHERWIKTFYTQPFCEWCIKYVLVFYKNYLDQFATIIWEVLHKKPPFGHSKNGKWFFCPKKNENFLRQHCLPFQDASS